jgi:protein involved in polysaccharide export with SLBB domain
MAMKSNCKVSIRRIQHLFSMESLAGVNAVRAMIVAIVGFVAGTMLVGCASSDSSSSRGFVAPDQGGETRLRNGDQIQVRTDTGDIKGPQAVDAEIDENGEISLPLINHVKAEGLTPSELSERIQANYVPRFYIRCTVTVLATVRFFYVGGEVRGPGRYNWSEDITLLKAINTAGGFNDYANRSKVELTRGKEKRVFNCEDLRQHPERDMSIQPGDSIYISRSIF